MSDSHPPIETMREYVGGTLEAGKSIVIARHFGECAECRTAAMLAFDVPSRIRDVVSDLLRDDAEGSHLGYEELEKLLHEGNVESEDDDGVIRQLHLENCQLCTGELHALRRFADDLAWRRTRRRLRVTMAAVAATVIVGIGLLFAVRESGPPPRAEAPLRAAVKPVSAPAQPLVVLFDGSGPITRDPSSGKLLGVPGQGEVTVIARLIEGGSFAKPPLLDAIDSREMEIVRGETPMASAPRLISPVGEVVESSRPRFSWGPRDPAATYEVTIYNSRLAPVTSSGVLRETTWTPAVALPRGQTFAWELTIHRGDQVSRHPRPPFPPARFHVVSEEGARRIQAAAQTKSHLVLAKACADEGLVTCARNELKALSALNPENPVPRRLDEEIEKW